MYSTIPIHWNIKSPPASPGRSRVGPAFYVFSFLGGPLPEQFLANTNNWWLKTITFLQW
jgi:hypothetical protein